VEVLRADAVVIGSGAGGAPAAALLAESGRRVVVLEAGPRLGARDFSADEAEMTARLGRTVASRDASINFYAGSCVGGSTVVNDALCWRTPPEVLEGWREGYGLAPLTDAALAPYLERAWRDVHAEPTGRSHLNRNAHRLELGAQRLGWASEAMPRNVRGCARLGRCNFGCPIDAKQSMLVTYVPRAERAGARVLAHTRAERIRVEAGAVTGVDAIGLSPDGGGEPRLRVEAPLVCVAAGVLATGSLLQRSGIGGRGAEPGDGIQVHSSVHVAARFEQPVLGWYGPTMAYAVSEFSDVYGRTGPGFMLENVAVHPIVTASALAGFGDDHGRVMGALPFLARAVVLLRDRTRGRVRAAGNGRVEIDYALLPGDLARLRDGITQLARAYLAADALEVHLPVHGLGPVRREVDLAQLRDAPLDASRLPFLYAVHLFGGAAMGGSPELGVCGPDGACWNARGLYVTDAAALPGNTGVNPQITIVANALRIADGIVAEASS
jgi:choline dehydrogenase-like flavoprotein